MHAIPQPSIRNRVLLLTAAIVAAVALSAPPPADAAGTRPQPVAVASGSRLEKACHRIPAARQKVERKIDLLEAGASTKGSIAWLQAKADRAASKGKTTAAELLTKKVAARRAALAALEAKLVALDAAAAACVARGVQP